MGAAVWIAFQVFLVKFDRFMKRDFSISGFDYRNHVAASDIDEAKVIFDSKCVAGSDYEHLNFEEALALYCYTKRKEGFHSYFEVNSQSRSGVISPETDWSIECIASAISKIKKTKRLDAYHRYISSQGCIENIYREKCYSKNHGFTSVSGVNENRINPDFDVYICFSASSKEEIAPGYVAPLSCYSDEEEYIYLQGVKFLVQKVVVEKIKGKNFYYVSVREV